MCAVGAGFHFLIFGFWSMLDVWKKKKKIIFLVNSVCACVWETERERERVRGRWPILTYSSKLLWPIIKVIPSPQNSHFLRGLGEVMVRLFSRDREADSRTQTCDLLLLVKGTCHRTKTQPLTFTGNKGWKSIGQEEEETSLHVLYRCSNMQQVWIQVLGLNSWLAGISRRQQGVSNEGHWFGSDNRKAIQDIVAEA